MVLGIGKEHSQGAEEARHRRHQDAPDVEGCRQGRRVDRAVAAEGEDREVARIAAALIEAARNARPIVALATRWTPQAAVARSTPSGRATVSAMARSARARSTGMLPPARYSGLTKPSTTLASVTVGNVPPRTVTGGGRGRRPHSTAAGRRRVEPW